MLKCLTCPTKLSLFFFFSFFWLFWEIVNLPWGYTAFALLSTRGTQSTVWNQCGSYQNRTESGCDKNAFPSIMSPGLKKKTKTSATGLQIDFFTGNYIFSLIFSWLVLCQWIFFPFNSKLPKLCEYDFFLIGTLT